jgi:hypothetical protein
MHSELRQLIRELLEQEIHALRMQSSLKSAPPQRSSTEVPPRHSVREEFVSMTSNADLANFVTRMLQLSTDAASCSALRTGQLVFKLAAANSNAATATHSVPPDQARQSNNAVPPNQAIQSNKFVQFNKSKQSENIAHDVARFERGLFTERECTKLDPAVRFLQIGNTVRITPLAADSLRRRGISTQRAES